MAMDAPITGEVASDVRISPLDDPRLTAPPSVTNQPASTAINPGRCQRHAPVLKPAGCQNNRFFK